MGESAYSVNCSAERLADSVSDSGLRSSEKFSASLNAPSSLPSPVLHPVLPRPSRPCSCIRRCREALICSSSVLALLDAGLLLGFDITGPLSRIESRNDFGDPVPDCVSLSAAGVLPETRLVKLACTSCRL